MIVSECANHDQTCDQAYDQEAPEGPAAPHLLLSIIIAVLSIALSTFKDVHKKNGAVVRTKDQAGDGNRRQPPQFIHCIEGQEHEHAELQHRLDAS